MTLCAITNCISQKNAVFGIGKLMESCTIVGIVYLSLHDIMNDSINQAFDNCISLFL